MLISASRIKHVLSPLCVCLMLQLSIDAKAAAVPISEMWQTNGTVHAIEVAKGEGADSVFIGGDFTYVGPESGNASVISPPTVNPSNPSRAVFDLDFTGGAIANEVHVAVANGNGGWYVGGDFASVTDSGGLPVSRSNIVEIAADGTVTAWDPGTNGIVRALFFDSINERLYVGGEFTAVDGGAPGSKNYLAALDTMAEIAGSYDTDWNPNPDGFIYALAHEPVPLGDPQQENARLYVAGVFALIDGVTRNRIARLKINHLTAPGEGDHDDGWNPDVNGPVSALAFDAVNSRLYAGGDFSVVNVTYNVDNVLPAEMRTRLAAFDTSAVTDNNVLPWSPAANDVVHTLGLLGNLLYIGGDFDTLNGINRGLAVSDVTNFPVISMVDWGGGNTRLPFTDADELNVSVRQITVFGSFIYVASNAQFSGDIRPVSRLEALNPTSGALIWSIDASGGTMNTVMPSDGVILIAGTFDSGGGRIRSNIAELDLSAGSSRGIATEWEMFVNGDVYSITSRSDGEALYIGGEFSRVAGTSGEKTRNNVALISAISNNNVAGWAPSVTAGVATKVRTVALSPDEATLYIGGDFSQVSLVDRNNIAALDTTVIGVGGLDVLIPGWDPGSNGEVYALLPSSDDELVFAAGDFSIMGGDLNSKVAALRVSNATSLSIDGLWAVNILGPVTDVVRSLALSSDDKTLYLAGDFTTIIDEGPGSPHTRNHVAALDIDPATDKWRVTAVDPNVTGTTVHSLELSSDDQMLWLGGVFTDVGALAVARNNVARYNLSESLLTEWDANADGTVRAIARNADDSLAIIGGDFSNFGAMPKNNLALFDTTRPTVTNHVAGGFYNTSPLDLILSCTHNSTAGPCQIYYTLDGNDPTQALTPYTYVQPPPGPPEPPPPPKVDDVSVDTEVRFFAKDAHGTVSEINSASYGIDDDFPTTRVQANVDLKDVLPDGSPDGYAEVSDTGVEIALVCEDSVGGATDGSNCAKTYYTTDGTNPHQADGTPSATARQYTTPITAKQLLPLKSYTLDKLEGAERDIFREMTLADIVTSEQNAAIRMNLDKLRLSDFPDRAVARNSITLEQVKEYVDLAEIRIDSIAGNVLANVVAAENIPDGAVTFADIDEVNLDLTQITLGSISRTAYSLADIPAANAPPPTYITASQVPLIRVHLDRSEDHTILENVYLEEISLEDIPSEFIPRSRLYGFVKLQFFSIDRAGNSEALTPTLSPPPDDVKGANSVVYYVDIGAPDTTASPNTDDNVFTSEIHVVLACDDYEGVVSGFSKPTVDGVELEATGSGCREGGTYYTFGGALPDPDDVGENGSTEIYTGPIPISSASVLRFMSVDELGNEEVAGFEVYAFTFSSVGQSGVGASGLMVWLIALLGLWLRRYKMRATLH